MKPKYGNEIPIGQAFYAQINKVGVESLFLRTYNGIVDLKDPSNTFSFGALTVYENNPMVQGFRPVELTFVERKVYK